MIVFFTFLAIYAFVCGWFFVRLLRWTLQTQRGCSCGDSLGSGTFEILHGPKTCYPIREALRLD